MLYEVILFFHILLFVYWLGSDIGVFYGVRYVTNPELPIHTRKTIMELLHWIDIFPRLSLVLMLPCGFTLAIMSGLLEVSPEWRTIVLTAIWAAGLIWLIGIYKIYKGAAGLIKRADYFLRIVLMIGLLWAGISSILGQGPLIEGVNWLAVKLILFSGIIACGLGLRLMAGPFFGYYTTIMNGGSTPELEEKLSTNMAQTKLIVVVLWVFVIAAGFLGVAQFF